MFLYITGCIGWAGREYLKATRGTKDQYTKEIQIDLDRVQERASQRQPGPWLPSVNSPAANSWRRQQGDGFPR